MVALGHQAAAIEQQNAIGVAHRGEPVGDHQGGAVGGEFFQCFLNERLALGIESAGRLVEQQDGRVTQDGAGDGDTLALSAGE